MTTKRILLAVTATLAASVLALVGWVGVDNTARAQGTSLQPSNVRVVNGPNAGEAVVSWDAVAGAAYYRVGWVSVPNYLAVTDAGRDWREAFYFVDLKNAGQTSFTVSRLEPGAQHMFLVGGNSSLYGEPRWSGIESLTLNSDTTACPTPTPTPGATATPTPGATATATPPPAAANGDYDADDDGLIEIRSIAQLDAIRHDLDGDGLADVYFHDDYFDDTSVTAYAAAFPSAAPWMGCPDAGCTGYELANDLDFHTAGSIAWIPVGYWNSSEDYAEFTADFDGNHRTISNLVINSAYTAGLFGNIGPGGKVRRVGLEAVNIVGDMFVGGLAGMSDSDSSISDSYVKGSISGSSYVGALVGASSGTINRSYADASVHGISGAINNGNIGGLVGLNQGIISNSYAEGSVSGKNFVGGLVGNTSGFITTSYATATVTGDYAIGGLAGYNQVFGSIISAYATGAVSANDEVGGLVGYDNGRHPQYEFDNHWDTEKSGLTVSALGLGQTTAELQTPRSNTGIYFRWNPNQWDFGTSSQYPVLKVAGLSVAAQRGKDTAGQPGAGNTADRAALVAFYEATGGNNNQWLSDAPLGHWYGVTTNADGRVMRPAREKKPRRRVLVVVKGSPRPMRVVQRARL